MKKAIYILLITLVLPTVVFSQEETELLAIERIKNEAFQNSQVMDHAFWLTDIYGPRLTGSREYKRAAEWARAKLIQWGLQNAHLEEAGLFGRGWSLKRFSAHAISPQVFPLIAYPKAWSPGTRGPISGDVIYLDNNLESYRGKLKGTFCLVFGSKDMEYSNRRNSEAHFEPTASRRTDSSLQEAANAAMPEPQRQRIEFDTYTQGFHLLAHGNAATRRFDFSPGTKEQVRRTTRKMSFCQEQGAAAILWPSGGDYGTMFVDGARVPTDPDTPLPERIGSYSPKAPAILPQITVSAEQYNRILRLLQKGEHVRMEMNLDVEFSKEDSVYNILAEIPGTDLKDEVVMIGAHFDSWHGGTGATDNAAGAAVCMEAMRILKALHLRPRRTIRIGLWGGEEQGALGSKAYVKKYLGGKGAFLEPGEVVNLKPAARKFSAYFNLDDGAGKIRGVYLQGNKSVLPIFRDWLAPFKDLGASTLTLSNKYGSDHLSFDAIGLPAFEFIQDPLDYETRTHHSNMDVYDRLHADDLKQAAAVVASFAYLAAVRQERLPRKP